MSLFFLLCFSLATLVTISLGLPIADNVDTTVPGVYVTDTYTDNYGVERRSVKAISTALHERLVYYSEYAAAAYCPPQQSQAGGKVACSPAKTCSHVEQSNTTIYTTWLNYGNNSATGFVAADHTKKKIVIAMRGSVTLSNWIADIKFFQTPCPQFGGKAARCSIGFLGFWEQSKDFALKGLQQGLRENPSYGIVVTGHSLGAAAAVYAVGELRAKYKKVELFSYGQPRAGNEQMSNFITQQGDNYRVTHTSDAVPKLPPEGGPLAMLSGPYKHISPEYWISNGTGMKPENIQVLEGLSNNNGNTGTMAFNIIAHVQYFQTNMYYCVLPLENSGLGDAEGTRRTISDEMAWPTSPVQFKSN